MIDIREAYLILTLLLSGFYLWNNLRYLSWWKRLPGWSVPPDFRPHTSVSILIPARNEATQIAACLQSVLNQHYPPHLMEIIVVDDFSEDSTPRIVQAFRDRRIRYCALADHVQETEVRAHKKKALEVGIQRASGTLILTTDADCTVPPGWLSLMVSYYEKHQPAFIAAPVNFTNEQNILQRFQSLDFTGMMLITGAGIHGKFMHLCNGANLAYPAAVFHEVGGFAGIDHLASGDDMLLLQKIARRYPDRIGFVKSAQATVLTSAPPTWSRFLNQRLRWASKSAAYREWGITLTLALVFAFCVNVLFSLVAALWWGRFALLLFLGQLLVKSIADFIMLREATTFFERKALLRVFPVAQWYHIIYITLVGLLANVQTKYVWKGRRVK